ncbi:unnamed protein product [Moneuplotes crassus]|uniref:Uncharacterized protein n=1 Tax=Euplotes crassus TaxID=5936 RepID=A0AAD1U7G5_EUPCR|nr:unnamed protein product [Moneuplotes crassus]
MGIRSPRFGNRGFCERIGFCAVFVKLKAERMSSWGPDGDSGGFSKVSSQIFGGQFVIGLLILICCRIKNLLKNTSNPLITPLSQKSTKIQFLTNLLYFYQIKISLKRLLNSPKTLFLLCTKPLACITCDQLNQPQPGYILFEICIEFYPYLVKGILLSERKYQVKIMNNFEKCYRQAAFNKDFRNF